MPPGEFFEDLDEVSDGDSQGALSIRDVLGRVLGVYVITRVAIYLAALYGRKVAGFGNLGGLFAGWDGQHYLAIAHYGYPRHADVAQYSRLAFFPLYPLVVRVFAHLTHLTYAGVGVFVSLVAGAGFVLVATKLVARYYDVDAAERAGILLCVFPGSFVLSLPYAEALALLLAATAILAAVSYRPYRAGVLAGLATATSPLMLGLLPVMAWRAWRTRERAAWVTLLMTPLGFVGYMVYLRVHTGHLTEWFSEERQAYAHRVDLFAPISWLSHWNSAGITELTCCLVFAGALWSLARLRAPIEWWLYSVSIVAVVLFDGALYVTPRVLLNAFPLILALGVATERKNFVRLAIGFSLLLPLLFLVYMTLGDSSGPP